MRAKFLSANNKLHFAWYDTQEVSAGTPQDHNAKRPRQPFTIQPFQGKALTIKDLLCISSNDTMHFAWYIERIPKGDPEHILWVCAGPSESLGSKRDWYRSVLPRSASPENLRFITSNNKKHYAWFEKGSELWVGRGSSDNLGKENPVHCETPPEVRVEFILYMASDDKQHYAFLKNGTFLVGTSNKLEHSRGIAVYDLESLADLMKV